MNLKRILVFIVAISLLLGVVSYTVKVKSKNKKNHLEFNVIQIGESIIEDLPDYKLISHDQKNLFFEFKNKTDVNLKLTYSDSQKY